MKSLSVKDWIIILAGLIGLAFFILLYPKVYPESAMRGMISEESAITKAQLWMNGGWAKAPRSMDSLTLRASIQVDQKQLEYLQEKFGLEHANKELRHKSLVYTRRLEWLRIDEVNFRFGGRSESSASAKTERVVIDLDRIGNIVGYRYTKAQQDTSTVTDLETTHPSLAASEAFDLDSARRMAREFLRQWAGRSPDNYTETDVQGSITGKKPVMEFVFTGTTTADEVHEQDRRGLRQHLRQPGQPAAHRQCPVEEREGVHRAGAAAGDAVGDGVHPGEGGPGHPDLRGLVHP